MVLKLNSISANSCCISLANLAVGWVLHQPGVTGALVGARSVGQALENAVAMSVILSPEDLAFMRSVFESVRINNRPGSER